MGGSIALWKSVALSVGLAFTAAASSLAATDATEQVAGRHRTLLQRAEHDLARGALQEGLTAVGEAVLIAVETDDALRLAAARVVRANLSLALGELDAAREDLARVREVADSLGAPELQLAAEAAEARMLAATGAAAESAAKYEAVASQAQRRGDETLATQSHVNAHRARVDSGRLGEAEDRAALRAQVARIADEGLRALLTTHLGVTARHALERGLGDRSALVREGDESLRAALVLADRLASPAARARMRARAAGHLGAIYALEGRTEEAIVLTGRAIADAARSDSRADLFPWHLQMARLQSRAGRDDQAIDAYAAGLEILEGHRGAIERAQRISSGARPGAGDVPRFYREYADRLLRRARNAESEEARRSDLQTAQSILERMKSDELRDYFEDDCVIRYREQISRVSEASREAAIVYPVLLDDRLELLVAIGSELSQVVVDVDRERLRREVLRFRHLLEKRTTRQYLAPARQLYAWLVEPLESILGDAKPRTLVFVPDGVLRTIPMAALHDGERFLIERYPLGLTPGLELTDPRPFDAANLDVLMAGLSESVDGFAALPNVDREIESIHSMVGGARLLNEEFSEAELTSRIRESHFGLIHIASHARFGASGTDGFLLAHDGPIAFDTLSDALSATRYRDEPLDLVILSACETAQGDERAALGLSGVAVRAGARSALGTLWQVDDTATAAFMARFYEALKEPGTSRAEAVRAGQVGLIRELRYRHPYYWSPFLLINSWL